VYIRSSGRPLFDAGGNFIGYRGTGTDITAMIRADRAEQVAQCTGGARVRHACDDTGVS
jgi:hypothetical protein